MRLMDISAEIARPGPDIAATAATYSLYAGCDPDSGDHDLLMQELFVMRFFLDGGWLYRAAPGPWISAPMAALWGSESSLMELRCPVPFRVFSIGLRTGALLELSAKPPSDFVDRVFPLEPILGSSVAGFHQALHGAPNIQAMADLADAWLASLPRCKMRPLLIERARIFEDFALYRWERSIGDIADDFHLSTRQLERTTLQCLGFKPKFLTRRHRFLNIAGAMRGIGGQEWQELCYRYYSDQSHMNREFRKFTRMTPGEFRDISAPLLDTTLGVRQMGYKLAKSPDERKRLSGDLSVVQRSL